STEHYGTCSINPSMHNPTRSVDQVVDAMNRCAVYLNCALWSPLPSVVAEAASCGAPIVSIDAPGVAEYLTHKHDAYLFPPDRPDLGRQYVQTLLNNPTERARIGNNARITA